MILIYVVFHLFPASFNGRKGGLRIKYRFKFGSKSHVKYWLAGNDDDQSYKESVFPFVSGISLYLKVLLRVDMFSKRAGNLLMNGTVLQLTFL